MAFVDTSFLFALANERESRHREAASMQRSLSGERLSTTNHVVGECWTLLNRKLGHRAAVRVVDAVRTSPRYEILRVSREIEERAWSWLMHRDEREYSFVDAVSFETMRENQIDLAVAFDADFEAAGFQLLRA